MKKSILIIAAVMALPLLAFRVVTFAPLKGGAEYTMPDGGKIAAVEAYSPSAASGTIALASVWAADIYTNAVEIAAPVVHTAHTVVWSNTVTGVIYTNTYAAVGVKPKVFEVALASNTVQSVTQATNEWPVFEKRVATTNSIVSGTASSGKYSGTPASATYLGAGEKLVFTGTAAGGFLRIILE